MLRFLLGVKNCDYGPQILAKVTNGIMLSVFHVSNNHTLLQPLIGGQHNTDHCHPLACLSFKLVKSTNHRTHTYSPHRFILLVLEVISLENNANISPTTKNQENPTTSGTLLNTLQQTYTSYCRWLITSLICCWEISPSILARYWYRSLKSGNGMRAGPPSGSAVRISHTTFMASVMFCQTRKSRLGH